MSNRNYPEDWDDWSSEDYESYIDEVQEWREELQGQYAQYRYQEEDWHEGDSLEELENVKPEEAKAVSLKPSITPPLPRREITWHYDDSGYYAYVLIDGDQSTLAWVKQELAKRNIICALSGRSYRPANNKRRYDWYIRVFKRADGQGLTKPLRGNIAEIFQPLEISARPYDFVDDLIQQVASLQNELNQTQKSKEAFESKFRTASNQLRRKEQDYSHLREQYAASERRFQEQLSSLQQQRRSLEDRLFTLAQELDQIKRTTEKVTADKVAEKELEDSILIEELQKANATLQADYKELEEVWKQTDAKVGKLDEQVRLITNERDMATAELENTRYELDELKRSNRSLQRSSDASGISLFQTERDFEQLLTVLLPNICLVRGSVSFLIHEVQEPLIALRQLQLLNSSPASIRSKRMEKAKNWLEIHFSTGESDAGRIYYTKPNQSSQYYVLVSHKNLQPNDLRWLSKWSHKSSTAN